ncbi:MAG TPA: mandelate racemase/muconate lactonizing enzyme family protein [Candidatus Limnocylindria bacterium]|nr:mandelate racemase/muconate lactonizing enzyme family protein [Candidatus Limnocylindria bacterium]
MARVSCALYRVPLAEPVSDAKVIQGRQRPLGDVDVLMAQVGTSDGLEGIGFAYSKRAGGPALFAHARQIAPLLVGEDPLDIGRLWDKLVWAAASIGRQGVAVQAVAAFDIALHDRKAKAAGMSVAKLLGSYRESVRCYDTGGGFLSADIDSVIANARRSVARGIGGIKLKVGGDAREDVTRVRAVRTALGDKVPLMVDANQQWDRAAARRVGRRLEEFDLEWIEEPLDCEDVAGHAALRTSLDTPIASGEMLSSANDHRRFLEADAVDVLQPDAPRIGGITPYRRVADLADAHGVTVAPHFATQLHVHLAAAQPREGWVEWFDWLEPLFVERLEVREGRVLVPQRPGLGLTLSPRAAEFLVDSADLPDA